MRWYCYEIRTVLGWNDFVLDPNFSYFNYDHMWEIKRSYLREPSLPEFHKHNGIAMDETEVH